MYITGKSNANIIYTYISVIAKALVFYRNY